MRGRSPSNGCDPSFRRDISLDALRREVGDVPDIETLLQRLYDGRLSDRNRSMIVLANRRGLSNHIVCSFLGLARIRIANVCGRSKIGGCAALFARQIRSTRKFDDEASQAGGLRAPARAALKLWHQPYDMDHV